jgi:hypothetical protein
MIINRMPLSTEAQAMARRLASWFFVLFAAPSLVAGDGASRPEITPMLGLRGGADLDPVSTGSPETEADPSASFGVVYDFLVRRDARLEIFLDRQELEFAEEGASTSGTERFDVTVDYLHVGGVYEPKSGPSRPFVAVDLGLTRIDADGATVDDSIGFSGSIGGGTKIALGSRLALRLEARGYATFSEPSFQAACGPGCTVNLSSAGWFQLAGRVGLVIPIGGRGAGP